jgi:hypothetical protein
VRKKLGLSLALVALVGGALSAPAGIATAAAKPTVVGTDPADDWGANADPSIAPAAAALGQELVEASIGMADAKTVNFIITLASLPPIGGMPELTRYTWDFAVNKKNLFELDGKFTNYSRGACDPTSGQCPPPRDPGLQPFLLRGNCRPDPNATNVTICDELGKVQAVFDAGAGTITIPVALEMLKAKSGSKISPGVNSTFGGTVVAVPSAFFSNATMPLDLLTATKTFTVPK